MIIQGGRFRFAGVLTGVILRQYVWTIRRFPLLKFAVDDFHDKSGTFARGGDVLVETGEPLDREGYRKAGGLTCRGTTAEFTIFTRSDFAFFCRHVLLLEKNF